MQDVKEILKRLKKVYGVKSFKELADKMGVSENTIDTWRARKHIPEKHILKTLQEKGVNKTWLLTGQGEMISKEKKPISNNSIEVEVLSVRPGAGQGTELEAVDLFDTGERILIDRSLLKTPPKGRLKAMQVDGYSMVPMLFPDSWVIIDETKEYRGDGLYVINFNNVLMVKLLEVNLGTGNLWVKSINPDYDSWEIKKEDQRVFDIFGKVVRCII